MRCAGVHACQLPRHVSPELRPRAPRKLASRLTAQHPGPVGPAVLSAAHTDAVHAVHPERRQEPPWRALSGRRV